MNNILTSHLKSCCSFSIPAYFPTHHSPIDRGGHGLSIGNGARLGSIETPKSERETVMDDFLVIVMEIVMEIGKYERGRHCGL